MSGTKARLWVGFLIGWAAWSATPACAGLIIENNALYYSSGLNSGVDGLSSKLFGSISVGASMAPRFQVGWNINYVNRSDNPGTGAVTLTGTEMGPRFGVFLGKSQSFGLAVAWHAIASATYTPNGAPAESWQGSGFQGELGYAPQITNHLFAGFKLIYDSVTYSKKTDANNLTSSVSYTQSGIIPALYLSWRF